MNWGRKFQVPQALARAAWLLSNLRRAARAQADLKLIGVANVDRGLA